MTIFVGRAKLNSLKDVRLACDWPEFCVNIWSSKAVGQNIYGSTQKREYVSYVLDSPELFDAWRSFNPILWSAFDGVIDENFTDAVYKVPKSLEVKDFRIPTTLSQVYAKIKRFKSTDADEVIQKLEDALKDVPAQDPIENHLALIFKTGADISSGISNYLLDVPGMRMHIANRTIANMLENLHYVRQHCGEWARNPFSTTQPHKVAWALFEGYVAQNVLYDVDCLNLSNDKLDFIEAADAGGYEDELILEVIKVFEDLEKDLEELRGKNEHVGN